MAKKFAKYFGLEHVISLNGKQIFLVRMMEERDKMTRNERRYEFYYRFLHFTAAIYVHSYPYPSSIFHASSQSFSLLFIRSQNFKRPRTIDVRRFVFIE